jgi:hypothetical protein
MNHQKILELGSTTAKLSSVEENAKKIATLAYFAECMTTFLYHWNSRIRSY